MSSILTMSEWGQVIHISQLLQLQRWQFLQPSTQQKRKEKKSSLNGDQILKFYMEFKLFLNTQLVQDRTNQANTMANFDLT